MIHIQHDPNDLLMENVSESVPAVSSAPLGNNFTIPLLDKLTLEMAKDLNNVQIGTNGEHRGPTGNQDLEEPGNRSTSGLGTRPFKDVTQVATHMGIEDPIPDPNLEPVEFDFQAAGVPHSPAGLFGGRYPDRKRNTVQQPENNNKSNLLWLCSSTKRYPHNRA
jgi:hypothetical protein